MAIQISVSGSDVLRLHCPKSRIVKYPQRNVEPCSCQREISLYCGMRQGAAAGKVSQEAGGVIPRKDEPARLVSRPRGSSGP